MAALQELGSSLQLPENSPQAQFYASHRTAFEQLDPTQNYLERFVGLTEQLGMEYTNQLVGQSPERCTEGQFSYQREDLQRTLMLKEFNAVERSNPPLFTAAVQIARETESLKRSMLFLEILNSDEWLSEAEKIIFIGSLAIGEISDRIYFDEWLPSIKDSPMGKILAGMEEKEEGSSAQILPGKIEDIRWHTREFINPDGPITKENIRLVPYRESLPSVPRLISVLDGLVSMLNDEKTAGGEDFGYADFFAKWSACLKGASNQKQLEDEMMIAWLQLDPQTPIFIAPWAEYAYNDPAGVAIVPSLRIGVTATDATSLRLGREVAKLKQIHIDFLNKRNLVGAESIAQSTTHHRVWTGCGGMNVVFVPSSQVLPNDANLRLKYGYHVMPDLKQQERGERRRIIYADKVYPPEILAILNNLRFQPEETAIYEMEGHENFHPAGVYQQGENNLGKLSNQFEEAKATLGSLLAQVENYQNPDFSRRAVASLLFPVPRYLTLDGNPTYQGYANEARIVMNIASQIGIITYDNTKKQWSLDLDDDAKINRFWQEINGFIKIFCLAYQIADSFSSDLEAETIIRFNAVMAHILNKYIGKVKDEASDELVDIPIIATIKQKLYTDANSS